MRIAERVADRAGVQMRAPAIVRVAQQNAGAAPAAERPRGLQVRRHLAARFDEAVGETERAERHREPRTTARTPEIRLVDFAATRDELTLERRPETPRDRAKERVARGERDDVEQPELVDADLLRFGVVADREIEEVDLGAAREAALRIEEIVEGGARARFEEGVAVADAAAEAQARSFVTAIRSYAR